MCVRACVRVCVCVCVCVQPVELRLKVRVRRWAGGKMRFSVGDCAFVYVCASSGESACGYLSAHTRAQTATDLSTHTHPLIHRRTTTHARTHANKHTHAHTCTHTHTRTPTHNPAPSGCARGAPARGDQAQDAVNLHRAALRTVCCAPLLSACARISLSHRLRGERIVLAMSSSLELSPPSFSCSHPSFSRPAP